MVPLKTLRKGTTLGQHVRRLRIASLLSQQQLACIVGVPLTHVALFERNLPVPVDSKRRILKELWTKKAEK